MRNMLNAMQYTYGSLNSENEKNEKQMKNGLLRIAAQCWIVHETLKH